MRKNEPSDYRFIEKRILQIPNNFADDQYVLLNGTRTFEEIIAATKKGLFAKRMGGSVNPATGEFNFAVMEGYLIEDGKITKPVRGDLVGSGKMFYYASI